MPSISRRSALKYSATGAVSVALANLLPQSRLFADETAGKKVRLAVIGTGSRGTALLKLALQHDDVEIPAICDINEIALLNAHNLVQKSRNSSPDAYPDYKRLLQRTDIDAVLIATPHDLHAEMTLDSWRAGKFVGSEVPAAVSVDECWTLLREQKRLNAGYMLLENYNYAQPVMQILTMVRHGLFGEATYAFGGYIHETRSMRFEKSGNLTWRGENVRKNNGIIYPTHALGPIAWWLDLGKKDKMQSLVAMSSKAISNHLWAEKHFGDDSEAAKVDFKNGDTNQCLIHTQNGVLIELRYDTASPRPNGMGQYSLQGTKGAYESAMGNRMVYLEGKTKGEKWEPLETYAKDYQHQRWAEHGAEATKAGHGGGDYFVIADFIAAIKTGISPIPIQDALSWSVIRPLSQISLEGGSKPVEIPDFYA